MESVADLVIAVIDKLDDIDPGLANTYVFFTSDHGFHMGEHRLGNQISQDDADGTAPGGKNSMYEEDIRVPLWVRGPGIAEDTVITDLIGSVDLAPTFCEIYRAVHSGWRAIPLTGDDARLNPAAGPPPIRSTSETPVVR